MLDNFNKEIEERALAEGSYIDAIVDYAAEKEMDVEDVAEQLHPIIVEKLKMEYKKKNYFPEDKIENSLDKFI